MTTPPPILDGPELAAVLDLEYDDFEDDLDQVAAAAVALIESLVRPATIAGNTIPAPILEAAISIGSEIWQARYAAAGQPVSVDFTPAPYRMSVWITRRVHALLGPYMNPGGMVG